MSVVASEAGRAFPEVEGLLAQLAAEDRSGWSGPARAARVLDLQSLIARLQAEQVRAVGDWDRDHAWQADEATSGATWLAQHADMTAAAAARLVGAARLARLHDPVGDALADGRIGVPQVEALARVERHREQLFARDADVLVDAAVRHPLAELAVVARRWRHLADDEASTRPPDEVVERWFLHASTTLGGTVRVDAELDPDGGAIFLAALDRHARPDPVDDPLGPRSLAHRRADALVDIARLALADDGARPLPRPSVDVLVDERSLAGRPPLDIDEVVADILALGPVPIETIRRLMCDAVIGAIVGRAGDVLDAKPMARFPSAAQRRAVIARDRHCAWPGCDRPARWCDVHHIVAVPAGGRTVMVNLVLLCRRHHTAVHERRWRLWRDADGGIRVARPDGTDVAPVRPGRAPPARSP
jgi:hypothetical protein